MVGSIVTDLSFTVPTRPLPGEVVHATSFGRYRGGKGYNQAVAAARLGGEVTMIGAIGRDPDGEAAVAALKREGVESSRVVISDEATGVAIPIITPDGDVAFLQHMGANRTLTPDHVADLPDADVVLLQGEIPTETNAAVARQARDRGMIVVLNPAPVTTISDEVANLADVITPNEVEAAELADLDLTTLDGLEAAVTLSSQDRVAVVTLGAHGAAWANSADKGHVVPPSVTAVDATGAGDSFTAALGVQIATAACGGESLRELDLHSAVRFACAAGAHAATIAGAEPSLPRTADVEALLQSSSASDDL